jgi:hypothetical protein
MERAMRFSLPCPGFPFRVDDLAPPVNEEELGLLEYCGEIDVTWSMFREPVLSEAVRSIEGLKAESQWLEQNKLQSMGFCDEDEELCPAVEIIVKDWIKKGLSPHEAEWFFGKLARERKARDQPGLHIFLPVLFNRPPRPSPGLKSKRQRSLLYEPRIQVVVVDAYTKLTQSGLSESEARRAIALILGLGYPDLFGARVRAKWANYLKSVCLADQTGGK